MKARLFCSLMSAFAWLSALAKSGSVDYSQGADGLADATAFVGTMMIYTIDVLYAVAAEVGILSSSAFFIVLMSRLARNAHKNLYIAHNK